MKADLVENLPPFQKFEGQVMDFSETYTASRISKPCSVSRLKFHHKLFAIFNEVGAGNF